MHIHTNSTTAPSRKSFPSARHVNLHELTTLRSQKNNRQCLETSSSTTSCGVTYIHAPTLVSCSDWYQLWSKCDVTGTTSLLNLEQVPFGVCTHMARCSASSKPDTVPNGHPSIFGTLSTRRIHLLENSATCALQCNHTAA